MSDRCYNSTCPAWEIAGYDWSGVEYGVCCLADTDAGSIGCQEQGQVCLPEEASDEQPS